MKDNFRLSGGIKVLVAATLANATVVSSLPHALAHALTLCLNLSTVGMSYIHPHPHTAMHTNGSEREGERAKNGEECLLSYIDIVVLFAFFSEKNQDTLRNEKAIEHLLSVLTHYHTATDADDVVTLTVRVLINLTGHSMLFFFEKKLLRLLLGAKRIVFFFFVKQ